MSEQYPEHEKLHVVKGKSQIIGEFIDWLQDEKRVRLYQHEVDCSDVLPCRQGIQELLAEFFEIDLNKLELEKRAMLDQLQKAQGLK